MADSTSFLAPPTPPATDDRIRFAELARRELALHRFGEVRLRAVARDELGMTHVRFDRMVAGIPLDGEQLIVHYDRHGGLRALSGPTDRPTLPPAGGATIDRVVAVASARAVTDAGAMVRALDLVAHRSQEGLRRAFSIDLRWTRPDGSPAGANVVVDAVSGAVLEQTAAARTAVAHSLHSGQVTLETTPVPGGFVLRDPTRGNSETRDARQQRPSSTPGFPATSTEIIDTDDQWGTPTDDRRNDVAVDAQHAAAVAWDFLRDMFGRDSLDNRGMAIRSNVHAGTNLIGAYWLDGQVFYGDGDGHTADPMVSLDFGLHEIFHGLTENTARLKKRGEPGALNEATSDILQAAARWWHARRMGNESIDWWLGRTTWTPGIGNDAARYMDHPSRDRSHSQYDLYDRDHYANLYRLQHDSGGVHMNAGIANNFFYLLVNGGTNDTSGVTVRDGIGMEKGARIWYRALTTYMTPTTRFADARVATLLAAQDLYGGDSAEARRVAEAWNAVGVAGPE